MAIEDKDVFDAKRLVQYPGFRREERESMRTLLSTQQLVDSFRHFYPQWIKYSYWNYCQRQENLGLRLDYFLVSRIIIPFAEEAAVHDEIEGSDHCPVSIQFDLTGTSYNRRFQNKPAAQPTQPTQPEPDIFDYPE